MSEEYYCWICKKKIGITLAISIGICIDCQKKGVITILKEDLEFLINLGFERFSPNRYLVNDEKRNNLKIIKERYKNGRK